VDLYEVALNNTVIDFEGRVLSADAFWASFASRVNRVFFGFSSSSRSFPVVNCTHEQVINSTSYRACFPSSLRVALQSYFHQAIRRLWLKPHYVPYNTLGVLPRKSLSTNQPTNQSMGLFVLFWVNIVFLLAMVAFCYCGIKALGRKGRREIAHEQNNESDDPLPLDGRTGVESASARDLAGAPSAPGQAARYGFIC
jgi:hypothetical protein